MRYDTFRGRTEEELRAMKPEEFLQLAKARARRAILRAIQGKNYRYRKLMEKVRRKLEKAGDPAKVKVKTHVREAVILPEWLGVTFLVYNGKEWVEVKVDLPKLGHRLGEFSHTTKPVKHSAPGIGATRGSKFIAAK